MSAIKRVIENAQVAMLGYVVPVSNWSEVDLIAQYITNELLGYEKTFDLEKRANQYNRSRTKHEVVGVAMNYAYDMPILCCVLKNDSKGDYRIVPYEFDAGDYCYSFCWAENLSHDIYSELGDVAFIKKGDEYRVAC